MEAGGRAHKVRVDLVQRLNQLLATTSENENMDAMLRRWSRRNQSVAQVQGPQWRPWAEQQAGGHSSPTPLRLGVHPGWARVLR